MFIVFVMLFTQVSVFATGTDQSSVLDETDVSTAVDDLKSVYSDNTEKSLLRERFEDYWQTHVASNCTAESDCDNHADEWPREISLP